jgi:ADP-ribose pyrophosphatase YjhB (NUDIX family)
MDRINKNGQTLEEFLRDYNPNAYKKPSVTSDVVLFSMFEQKPVVLLIERGDHPHIGEWALPGGFLNEQESCESAAARELFEETGISDIDLEQLVTVSTPHRDVRGWTVSNCFFAVIESPEKADGGDDAASAQWFTIDYAAAGDSYEMILKSLKGDITLRAVLETARGKRGALDLNETQVALSEGIAFDHAKLILYAIEKL